MAVRRFPRVVAALLALGLGVFHRKAHAVRLKKSALWSAVWVALALAFNDCLYLFARDRFATNERLAAVPGFDAEAAAQQVGLECLTCYIVEKALAVDDLFVFMMVFTYFAVPKELQHRVLFYGIIGAILFRAIFIGMGSILLDYKLIVVVFGVLLIVTGIRMLVVSDKPLNPEATSVIRLVQQILPVTPTFDGPRFFVRKAGVLYATPLLVALVFVEVSGIILAVDSVPASFAITSEPFLVFTSNVFAILCCARCTSCSRASWAASTCSSTGSRPSRLRRPEDGVAQRGVRRHIPHCLVAWHYRHAPRVGHRALVRGRTAPRAPALAAPAVAVVEVAERDEAA